MYLWLMTVVLPQAFNQAVLWAAEEGLNGVGDI